MYTLRFPSHKPSDEPSRHSIASSTSEELYTVQDSAPATPPHAHRRLSVPVHTLREKHPHFLSALLPHPDVESPAHKPRTLRKASAPALSAAVHHPIPVATREEDDGAGEASPPARTRRFSLFHRSTSGGRHRGKSHRPSASSDEPPPVETPPSPTSLQRFSSVSSTLVDHPSPSASFSPSPVIQRIPHPYGPPPRSPVSPPSHPSRHDRWKPRSIPPSPPPTPPLPPLLATSAPESPRLHDDCPLPSPPELVPLPPSPAPTGEAKLDLPPTRRRNLPEWVEAYMHPASVMSEEVPLSPGANEEGVEKRYGQDAVERFPLPPQSPSLRLAAAVGRVKEEKGEREGVENSEQVEAGVGVNVTPSSAPLVDSSPPHAAPLHPPCPTLSAAERQQGDEGLFPGVDLEHQRRLAALVALLCPSSMRSRSPGAHSPSRRSPRLRREDDSEMALEEADGTRQTASEDWRKAQEGLSEWAEEGDRRYEPRDVEQGEDGRRWGVREHEVKARGADEHGKGGNVGDSESKGYSGPSVHHMDVDDDEERLDRCPSRVSHKDLPPLATAFDKESPPAKASSGGDYDDSKKYKNQPLRDRKREDVKKRYSTMFHPEDDIFYGCDPLAANTPQPSPPYTPYRYRQILPFRNIGKELCSAGEAALRAIRTESNLPHFRVHHVEANDGAEVVLVGSRSAIMNALDGIARFVYRDCSWSMWERDRLRDERWAHFHEPACRVLRGFRLQERFKDRILASIPGIETKGDPSTAPWQNGRRESLGGSAQPPRSSFRQDERPRHISPPRPSPQLLRPPEPSPPQSRQRDHAAAPLSRLPPHRAPPLASRISPPRGRSPLPLEERISGDRASSYSSEYSAYRSPSRSPSPPPVRRRRGRGRSLSPPPARRDERHARRSASPPSRSDYDEEDAHALPQKSKAKKAKEPRQANEQDSPPQPFHRGSASASRPKTSPEMIRKETKPFPPLPVETTRLDFTFEIPAAAARQFVGLNSSSGFIEHADGVKLGLRTASGEGTQLTIGYDTEAQLLRALGHVEQVIEKDEPGWTAPRPFRAVGPEGTAPPTPSSIDRRRSYSNLSLDSPATSSRPLRSRENSYGRRLSDESRSDRSVSNFALSPAVAAPPPLMEDRSRSPSPPRRLSLERLSREEVLRREAEKSMRRRQREREHELRGEREEGEVTDDSVASGRGDSAKRARNDQNEGTEQVASRAAVPPVASDSLGRTPSVPGAVNPAFAGNAFPSFDAAFSPATAPSGPRFASTAGTARHGGWSRGRGRGLWRGGYAGRGRFAPYW
ncbi:hypothetical protein JCM10213_002650 [Rhodosporidiobolus nylandii]